MGIIAKVLRKNGKKSEVEKRKVREDNSFNEFFCEVGQKKGGSQRIM